MSVHHRIALTGGGTGGHVYPALAVAETLREDASVESLLYIGVAGALEEKLAQQKNIEFVGLKASGMPRKLSLKALTWPGEMLSAIMESRKILGLFRPTAVLGTGGYASAPPLAAAALASIPYLIHEPDAHPGLVNRVFAGNAAVLSLGMEAAASSLRNRYGNPVVNGNPVRKSFLQLLKRDAACAVLGLNRDLKTVLVTGGSQGAQAINEALLGALPSLLGEDPPLQIIHQAGDKNIQGIKERLDRTILDNPRYVLRPYFEDLALAYAACDLAVCRAGAMTIAELCVTGTPALFIPYPYAAADHQTHNARFMTTSGASVLLVQAKLSKQTLYEAVRGLLANGEKLQSMRSAMLSMARPHAAADLSEQLKKVSASYLGKMAGNTAEI